MIKGPMLALIAVLAAGCVAADPEPYEAPFVPTTSSESPLPPPVTVELNATPPPDPSFREWLVMNHRGAFAARIKVDVTEKSDCEFSIASSNRVTKAGPSDIIILTSKGLSAWIASSDGHIAQAHAGPIDTRTLTNPSGAGALRVTFHVNDFQGPLLIEMAFVDLEPFGESETVSEWLPNGSVARVTTECGAPIALDSLHVGNEAHLFNQQSMSGGAGASVLFEASANVNDQTSYKTTLNQTYAVSGSFGYQAGNFEWRGPGKSKSCTLDPLTFVTDCRLEGGPGTYSASLTRAAAYFDAFWAVVYSVVPAAGLDELAASSADA